MTQFPVQPSKEKRKNEKFSYEERYFNGKYASVHGPCVTVKKFRKPHPHLSFDECTSRSLRPKYQELLKSNKEGELASSPQLKRGRSLMLDKLDEKMKNVLHVLTSKAGVDNNFILSKKYFLTHEVYKRSMHHL